MTNPLWKFIDDKGSFVSNNANKINSLYLPLCNTAPFMSSITATLKGDIKINNNAFLLEPVSRISLANSKASRNFWIYINPGVAWSATGVSKDCYSQKNDSFKLQAGILWQTTARQNKKIGLRAEITSFVPSSADPLEIMAVKLTNITKKPVRFVPTAAIPVYARSSENLRDHRHVTSLLNRTEINKFGVIVTPTLLFDESGHKKNDHSYFVFGIGENSETPEHIYPSQEEFCGEASDLEAPQAVIQNKKPDKKYPFQGKETMGALKFKAKTLKPEDSYSYIIVMGITHDKTKIPGFFCKFDSIEKVSRELEATKAFWQNKSGKLSLKTQDTAFDNWFRWVSIQPLLRKIFGCSFLPDFDYGKGGRGWRDLWQDCLSLILTEPEEVRSMLINNFKGVRIDGSNATIIGPGTGEFIADRNNISRVWMDHGIWPLITTLLYIHQSSDINMILEEVPYFRDHQLCRGKERDFDWKPDYGKEVKTKEGKVYKGTILEHMLLETLVPFYNVGPHNHIRLENADWNDGLDMAADFGESVAFSCMYAQNLYSLCDLVKRSGLKQIAVFKELAILINNNSERRPDYSDKNEKSKILSKYFKLTKLEINGERIYIDSDTLVHNLKEKADWMTSHVRQTEWLKEGFFNGYYDNSMERVEGKKNGLIHMTLTGQVFPVMSGIATAGQITSIIKNVDKYLRNPDLKGIALNTDFVKEQPGLGRAFSFIYGDKENGAFFNHMAVMFSYALYKQGLAKEAFECLDSIYRMAANTKISKIYPCLPEYFNSSGRGMYCYLTGSASWYCLTVLTQAFGIRGEFGDLLIEPKLTLAQFKPKGKVSINTYFAGKRINVTYLNPNKKDFGSYSISKIAFNGKIITDNKKSRSFLLNRSRFLSLAHDQDNTIEITLA